MKRVLLLIIFITSVLTKHAVADVCSGTPSGISVSATQSWSCSSYSPTLSLSDATTTGYSYQWQSSPDNSAWTSVSGATNATYTPTVTASTYYRCVVTCVSSGGFENTPGINLVVSTTAPLPYNESFESITVANALPSCMAATNLSTITKTYLAPTGSYNQAAHTGTKFASFRYGASDWFFTPSFAVTAGNMYRFSFWYVTDGTAGWTTLQAMYGTSQTAAGMTTAVGTAISGATNTTYAQYVGTFTATTTGTINIGINCVATTAPWYLSIDDISFAQLTNCAGTPSGITVNATQTYNCSSYSPTLSLSDVTTLGYSYQWQSSADSSAWTDVSGATNATYVPTVSSSVYYRCAVTCTSGGGSMNTPGVHLVLNLSTPLPYTESFESITAANALPACMAATNLATYTKTYLAPTGSYNQAAHTGTKFASFRYGANDWFFTPALSVTAGNTYQVSFWYVTDGYSGWTTLQAKYGTSQTAAGMTTAVGTPVSGATNTTYAQYIGTFTATTTGSINVGINCVATTAPLYLTIDDIKVIQLAGCTGTPSGITVNTTQSYGCSAYTPTLSLSDNTTLGYSYQWQSSPDSSTWTDVSAATNATYIPTVSASTYYRCVVTCVSSGGFMNTPGVKLVMTPTVALPYNESFEGIAANNALPPCMAATNLSTVTRTYLAATGLYNQAAHTGTKFASFRYTANDWFFTPGFAVTAGTTYQFSFWYVTDGYSGWTTLQAQYGTSQTAAGMTGAVGTPVSGATNTTYAQYTGVFTATTTGTIYIGINCVASSSPMYLSIDDLNLTQLPGCTGTPSGISVNATQSYGCSTYSPTLSLSGITTSGYTFQWQSSADSSTWTDVSGATSATYIPTVSASSYYRCVVTCGASGGFMNTPGVHLVMTPTVALPYTESFEGITAANALPPCMAATNLSTITKTYLAPTGSYNQAAHTGTKFASFRYSANDWFFTPGFAVTAGNTYQFSFWYVTDGTSGWTTLQAMYGTSQTAAGMTGAVGTPISGATNTTYAQYTGVFTATTTGTIYIGINCVANSTPWYLSIDDLNLIQLPACTGTPTGVSASASQSFGCTTYSPTLSLSGITTSGFSFQWQSSADSSAWTNVAGATGATYTPTVTSSIYYRCVVTCTSGGSFMNTAGVHLVMSATTPLPYSESFEGITAANALPTCMAATNLSTITKTYIAATGLYNQAAHTGTKFASFRYGASDWFFTPSFAVTAGNTYKFSFWYVTDGYSGWTTLQAKYGTDQSAAGMTTAVGTAISGPINTSYAQYVGTFTATTTGTIYIGINCVATTSPEYLSIDDINFAQLNNCAGTPSGITVNATQTYNCSTYSPTLSLSDNTTLGFSYQWQSSPDSSTWTDASGATNATYTPTVSASTYYRCVVTCIASGGFMNTPGVNLIMSPTVALPYYESFEGITANNALPPCMAATNLSTVTKTYTAATGSYNQAARTGTKFASFRYGAADWFYTPGFAVTAGNSYQFSFWYVTDGDAGWTTLQAMYGTSQTAAGMTGAVGTPVSGATNTTYAQYTGVFTATTTGIIYIGINCVATSAPWYLSIDDINLSQLPNCTGTPSGVSASASKTFGCSPYSPTLSLSGIATSGFSFQWQSSADSSTWTNVSGATGATYTPTVTSSIYYRCIVTCASSGGFMNTAGVHLLYSATTPLPYTESFEGITAANALPTCMASTNMGSYTYTYIAPTGSYNQAAHTGTKFASFRYGANDWFFTPGFAVTAGNSYQFSFWYVTDGYSGWTTLQAMYGTDQTAIAMTGAVGTPVSNATNTTYAQYTGVFTATTTGTIYIGINCVATGVPWYLSIDDINLTELPGCTSAPTGVSVNASQSFACSTYAPSLSLSGVTASGLTYQWQSSADSTTWTDVLGATNAVYSPTVSTTTYYRAQATCPAVSSTVATPGQALTIGNCIVMPQSGTSSVTTCGASYYSSGGPSGNYNVNESGILTIYPGATGTGSKVSIHFNSYYTEPSFDYLYIYNGNSTTGALLYTGNGTTIPPDITSTAADGSLTFKFTSDASVVYSGWNAVITNTNPNPITTQPAAVLACQAQPANISVAAGGTNAYQWYSNSTNSNTGGTLISGATDSSYSVPTAALGTTYYYVRVINACGTVFFSNPGSVVVNALPSAIGGTPSVCTGFSTSLTDVSGGGTWASSDAAIGSINASSGILQGITAGTTTVSYTVSATGCSATQVVTVNAPPPAIAGTMTVCATSATTLSNSLTGGTWSSGNPGIVSVGISNGIVTGNASGSALISYTSTAGCYTVTTVTVNPLPATTISPASATVCLGNGAAFTASAPLPLFSLLAEDFNSGLPSSWSVTNVSGTPATYWQAVDPPSPGAGTVGDGTKMLEADANNASIAGTVLSTIVTSPSFSTVGYGSATLTFNQYLLSLPTDDIVAVEYSIDNGTTWTSMLSQIGVGFTLPGGGTGAWSADAPEVSVALPSDAMNVPNVKLRWNYYSNGGAQWDIDNVKVSGQQPPVTFAWAGPSGLACTTCDSNTLTPTATGDNVYTVTSTSSAGCTLTQQVTVSVNPSPSIGGTLTVCVNGTTTLTGTGGDGTWSSASGNVTVGTSGAVTGLAAGTATITYTSSTGCAATAVVTVNDLPSATTGSMTVCMGATTTLANASGAGTWSSGNTSIASVDGSGVVTGASAGNADISFTLTATGCTVASTVTVNQLPAAIGGTPQVCIAATTTLSDVDGGGTWSSSATGVATIDADGVVTGVTDGTTTITYTASTSCAITMDLTVNPLPANITGTAVACEGVTTTLANASPDGSWSSSAFGTAIIDPATGVVTGMSQGIATITYQLPTGCISTTEVTINPLPANIDGNTQVCEGLTTTLSDVSAGGTWNISGTAATIDASGVVTGVTSGDFGIVTYTLPTGCSTAALVTVNQLPAAITGTQTVCEGSLTTLFNTSTGGTWSSSAIATASVDASGVVSGINDGIATITYQLPTGCVVTATVTVNPLPGAITGSGQVCIGTTATLGSGTSGGTWTSDDASIAAIGSTSGIVSGLAIGNTTVTYTLSTGCNIAAVVTVNPPSAPISGALQACIGVTSSLTDSDLGGTWSSDNTAIAVIDVNSGALTGVGAGNVNITYTSLTGCMTSAIVTVNSLPAPIAGIAQACEGSSAAFTDGSTGGTWSSSTPLVATVDGSGNISAIAAGVTMITYTLPTGCQVTRAFTVNAQPAANTGTLAVCQAGTTLLSNFVTGGTWVSGTPSVAMVDASGTVTGNTAGTASISYVMPSGCSAVSVVTVNAQPAAIAGTATVCENGSVTMTDVTTGGSWTSGNTSAATIDVNTGVVTAVAAGNTLISYSTAAGCIATRTLVVNAAPANITGGSEVCTSTNLSLSNSTTGGAWTSSNPSIATVGLFSGIVTGTTAGTTNISYTLSDGCAATVQLTVDPTPAAITGSLTVCNGQTIALTSTTLGGSWTSSNTSVATIDGTGSVTALAPGNATITYALAAGCMRTVVVTVNANPAIYNVTGGGSYCEGGTGVHIGLSGSDAGVNYQLQAGSSPTGSTLSGPGGVLDFGLITTANTYSIIGRDAITGCATTMSGTATVSVNPVVTPVVTLSTPAGDTMCAGTSTVFTATAVNGGTTPTFVWNVNGTVVAGATSNTYTYTPAHADVVTVTLISSACAIPASVSASKTMTVTPPIMPSASVVMTPAGAVCEGYPATFTATAGFGGTSPAFTWYKNGTVAATGNTFAYTPANGDVVFVWMTSNYACRLADSVQSTNVTVTTAPVFIPTVTITADPGFGVAPGTHVTLTANVAGGGSIPTYQWYVNGASIAGATSSTFGNTFNNGDSVTCQVVGYGPCGHPGFNSVIIRYDATGISTAQSGSDIRLVPNPNKGEFSLKGTLAVKADGEVSIEVTNMLGQVVYRGTATTKKGNIDQRIKLDNTLANGMYLLNLISENEKQVFHFVIEQ